MKSKSQKFFNTGESPIVFTIPTYRSGDVAETVERYSNNFRNFGHSIPILVFDDGRGEESRKRAIKSFSDVGIDYGDKIWYVGELEKGRFLSRLESKTQIDSQLLQKMFRPSYGGNRNYTLVYTIGSLYVTSDDDMHPEALYERQKGLAEGEVAKGRYVPTEGRYQKIPDDIMIGFIEALGKRVDEVPESYLKGNVIQDSSADLMTNNTKSSALASSNTLTLIRGEVPPTAVIKLAQSFRTGSSDVDTKDYVDEFLRNPALVTMSDLSKVYTLSDRRPCVTKVNWRFDNGVAGFDNRQGLPPFIPTSLRFEDYMFRIWSQKPDIASAHVDAVQTHRRNPSNRPSLASDFLNEELSAVLKDELRRLNNGLEDLTLSFDDGLHIDSDKVKEIFDRGQKLYLKAQAKSKDAFDRKGHYIQFANSLFDVYARFDFDTFYQQVKTRLEDEVDLLRKTLAVWPRIIEEAQKIPKFAKQIEVKE